MLSSAGSPRGSRLLPLLLAGLILMAAPSALFAQAVTGTLLGTVTDSTGAVIAGAKVTVTNQNTGFTRTVKTDAIGEYTVPSIPTGIYTVLAEMDGFKATALSQVEVGVDQRARIDVKLEVGAMTESVTIEAQSPLVQTSSSELGTTVKDEQIQALPLNGRNFVSLTRGVPGVLRGIPGANIDGAGSLAWRASASFSANGQRSRDNNYMLDGVDNNETWLQTVVIFPSVDALDEFKLQTSTYSAEFGRSLGGVVNLQIKSGTNSYRGSAFEFHRNDALDANNFFNNRAGRAKPDFTQNQFGGTFGGPIFQDKTFFFADYQGHREKLGHTFLSTVPSNKMRAGDFSEISRVIYDPATGQPFPGNFIPSDRWDDASTNILRELYPAPNTAGTIGAAGTANQQLPDQPREGTAGQPVRPEGGPQPLDQQPVLHALQLSEGAPPPAGDAGARGCRRDLRCRRREHRRAGRGVQRHAHLCQQLAERVPVRLDADRIRDDVDRPRIEPRARNGHPGHQRLPGSVRDVTAHLPEHPESRRQQQPAAHHEPERLPDLRQRHVDQGQTHAEVRRQHHASGRARSSMPTTRSGSFSSTTTRRPTVPASRRAAC